MTIVSYISFAIGYIICELIQSISLKREYERKIKELENKIEEQVEKKTGGKIYCDRNLCQLHSRCEDCVVERGGE